MASYGSWCVVIAPRGTGRVELRDIEIFLTLAEELHFGRTAQRLYVSQARVSQALKKQERGVGARLFERNSRNVRLTPLGEQLRADLLPVYRGLQEGVERARLAARGTTEVLRVGMLPSNAHDLRPYWEAFRARHPQWALRIRHNPFVDAFGPLRRGDIDVLVAWLPVEEPDLTVRPVIYTEHAVALVAHDHELAVRPSVSLGVFGRFRHLAGPGRTRLLGGRLHALPNPQRPPDRTPQPGHQEPGRHVHPGRCRGRCPQPGRPRHPLPRLPRHRLIAYSRLSRPALGPGLAQRHRVRPRPGTCPGRGGLGTARH
ncbi:LysR family transcriptional regulator [Streptomyces sp. NPDC002324]